MNKRAGYESDEPGTYKCDNGHTFIFRPKPLSSGMVPKPGFTTHRPDCGASAFLQEKQSEPQ